MPRLLLPAIALAATAIAAICAWQLRQPASVDALSPPPAVAFSESTAHPPQGPASGASLSHESYADTPLSPFFPAPAPTRTAPSLTASSVAPEPEHHFRGSDDTPATTPVQFDAVKPVARRFEIYPRILAAPAFARLPAPVPSVVLDLAPRTREPIALLDEHEATTPAQAIALESIADDFLDRVEETAGTANADEVAAGWEQAQADADSIYRNIFGEAAYQQRLTEAAIRALGLPVTAQ